MKKRGVKHREDSAVKTAARPGDWRLASLLDARLVGLMLAIKAVVLVFGAQAYVVSSNQSLSSLYEQLAIWNRWDAPHYLDIARLGYVSQGVEARWIVFYPLYPWLVRACASVLQDELVSAFFVSTLASLAAGLLLYRLAELDEPEAVARASVFFMFIFPTSYFLHIGYTESLFIALAVGAFLAARVRRWWLAGLLGALASLTRINGLLLVPALAFEVLEEYRGEGRRWRWEWLWVAAVGLGFGVYLLINWKVFGDPRAFLKMQDQYWSKSLTWPWVGIMAAWNSTWGRAPSEAQMVGWQEFFFVLLGLGLTVWAWLRLRASYAVWMTLNWLLWTSTKFVLSVPRYTLVMFPAYILLARACASRPVLQAVVTVWSLLFLALFAARFVQGHWAF
ncbi:MAG TPA: glycosyltransferase family 39 protein [Pyrinomonadaceae bacterium]|jgi:Gpi18-like mannosyltransferase|nr:glycosyltransferase family 39 protein [Pyrinomonadaceae bacterium]